jgi:hypothetical protein
VRSGRVRCEGLPLCVAAPGRHRLKALAQQRRRLGIDYYIPRRDGIELNDKLFRLNREEREGAGGASPRHKSASNAVAGPELALKSGPVSDTLATLGGSGPWW